MTSDGSSRPVAIVTGGAGGIGRAIAARLVQSGHLVVSADLAHGDHDSRDGQIAVHLDLTSDDSAASVVDAAARRGPLRALVNCAGIIRECAGDEAPGDGIREMLEVNLLGAARMSALAAPRMARGSAIVNISSISSRLPEIASAVLYGASKSALETYTRASARSLAPKGIRVNAVAPGFIDVSMSEAMRTIAHAVGSPLRRVALGRMGTADEVAACVDFLLSDDASYVVGATLVVDGGLVVQ